MSQLNTPQSTAMAFRPAESLDAYDRNHLQNVPQAPEDWACPICHEDIEDGRIASTHCKHLFHRACLLHSLSTPDVDWSNKCPACRVVLFTKPPRAGVQTPMDHPTLLNRQRDLNDERLALQNELDAQRLAIQNEIEARHLAIQNEIEARRLAEENELEARREAQRRWQRIGDWFFYVENYVVLGMGIIFAWFFFCSVACEQGLLRGNNIQQCAYTTSVGVWRDEVRLQCDCTYALMPPCGEFDLDGRTVEQWNATLYEERETSVKAGDGKKGGWSMTYELCNQDGCRDHHCGGEFARHHYFAECSVYEDSKENQASKADAALAACQASFQRVPEQEQCN
jgi:hypothetical protein